MLENKELQSIIDALKNKITSDNIEENSKELVELLEKKVEDRFFSDGQDNSRILEFKEGHEGDAYKKVYLMALNQAIINVSKKKGFSVYQYIERNEDDSEHLSEDGLIEKKFQDVEASNGSIQVDMAYRILIAKKNGYSLLAGDPEQLSIHVVDDQESGGNLWKNRTRKMMKKRDKGMAEAFDKFFEEKPKNSVAVYFVGGNHDFSRYMKNAAENNFISSDDFMSKSKKEIKDKLLEGKDQTSERITDLINNISEYILNKEKEERNLNYNESRVLEVADYFASTNPDKNKNLSKQAPQIHKN